MTDLHALLREAAPFLRDFANLIDSLGMPTPAPEDLARYEAFPALIARIDAALAEPQEPVAWRYRWAHGQDLRWRFIEKKPRNTVGFEKADVEPLYAPQPAQEKP